MTIGGASSVGDLLDSWVLDFARKVAPDQSRSLAGTEPSPEDQPRILRTEQELWEYVWTTFGVRIPNMRVCPQHCTPWEAFCDGYFGREPMTVIKGSRGLAGKSWLLALLGTCIATTLRGDVTILAGSSAQSKNVHKAMAKFWAAPNAPRELLRSEPGVMKTKFKWGNEIEALTASQTSVRGPHPVALLLDEVDEMDLAIFDASMGQTMDANGHPGRTVISSTHQYEDGTMTEVLKRAAERGWVIREWCYRETLEPHGWLTASQVARKRSEMTTTMWQVEVELQEPSPEGLALPREKVERMFVGELLACEGEEFAYREFEPPVAGASYATGGDWARDRDYVAIVTWRDDVWPLRLVSFQQFRQVPTPLILKRWEHQLGRYPGAAAHDATGGGTYLKDFLADSVEDVVMVGHRRKDLFVNYLVAIEHEDMVSPRIATLYRQHRRCRNKDLWSQQGHPPDGLVAAALAYKVSAAATRPLRLMGGLAAPEPPYGHVVPVPAQAPPPASVGLRRALDRLSSGNGSGNSDKA